MADTLAAICAQKRAHIAKRKAETREDRLRERAHQVEAPRGFKRALQHKLDQGGIGLIAEIKKASPSGGLIRADFDPATLAKAYAQGGATCLSVLTDEPFFQGHDDYIAQARQAVPLPVLRKDFMLDPYQIYESRALGADCILLILAALNDAEASILADIAFSIHMDVLVEVHDEDELKRALGMYNIEKMMLGINNRNLKTLETDLLVSETLAKSIPAPIFRIGESGIRTRADIARMQEAGIHCFLVGESLMREDNVEQATERLLAAK